MGFFNFGSETEFEFSALVGGDLLTGGDDSLDINDSFTMSFSASALFSVTDNDTGLSGDAWNDEGGDDKKGQLADITVDGELLYEGVKIYAEQVYILRAADGSTYYMVEIEVAGASDTDLDDFYAFIGDVPPGGTELTVVGETNVYSNWIKYRALSAGLDWSLDGAGSVTIEAEDMSLSNYRIDDIDAASGGEVIKLKRGEGEASVTFGAEDGVYDLTVAYVDENDGEGQIEVLVNGVVIATIDLDQNTDGNGGDGSSISTIVIPDIEIAQGDEILLRGARDDLEFARIDAVTFRMHQPPVAPDLELSIDEDGAIAGAVVATDDTTPAADLAYSLAVTAVNGISTIDADGNYTYTPAADFNGVDSFVYQVMDEDGDISFGTVSIVVDPVNDDPVGDDLALAIDSGETLLGQLTATDVDGDALTFTLASGPTNGAVDVESDGSFTYVSNAGFGGDDSFTFDVSDGFGGSDTRTVDISVLLANTPPTAPDVTFTVDEDGTATGTIPSFDPDAGDVLTFTGPTISHNGILTLAPDGDYTYTPSRNFNGADVFQYSVTDGNSDPVVGTFTVTVTPVNDDPNAISLPVLFINEDTPVDGELRATDPDDDSLTYSIFDGPDNGQVSLDSATGLFTYTPDGNFNGLDSFIFQANDGVGGTDLASVRFNIAPVADGPITETGGAGNDVLFGAEAGDTLDGAGGDDRLVGRGGGDSLTGGAGLDTFVFNIADTAGSDVIQDFQAGIGIGDVIELAGFGGGITELGDLTIGSNGAGDAVISLSNGVQIELSGVAPGALVEDDFNFV